jgi:hypothetical protein
MFAMMQVACLLQKQYKREAAMMQVACLLQKQYKREAMYVLTSSLKKHTEKYN